MKKIIYFDESSAADMLDIKNGGSMLSKLESNEESGTNGEASIGAKTKLLFKSWFFKAEADMKANLQSSFADTDYFNKTITNTILSDTLYYFINEEGVAVSFNGYKVELVKNSIAYMQSISPYLGMIESNKGIEVSENMNISLNKIDATLKNSKGYYEVLAKKGKSKKIFRFNNMSFRNNYGLHDLINMDLVFYGVRVGKMDESKLDFSKFLSSGEEIITSLEEIVEHRERKLEVFDIILAGVQ